MPTASTVAAFFDIFTFSAKGITGKSGFKNSENSWNAKVAAPPPTPAPAEAPANVPAGPPGAPKIEPATAPSVAPVTLKIGSTYPGNVVGYSFSPKILSCIPLSLTPL